MKKSVEEKPVHHLFTWPFTSLLNYRFLFLNNNLSERTKDQSSLFSSILEEKEVRNGTSVYLILIIEKNVSILCIFCDFVSIDKYCR